MNKKVFLELFSNSSFALLNNLVPLITILSRILTLSGDKFVICFAGNNAYSLFGQLMGCFCCLYHISNKYDSAV